MRLQALVMLTLPLVVPCASCNSDDAEPNDPSFGGLDEATSDTGTLPTTTTTSGAVNDESTGEAAPSTEDSTSSSTSTCAASSGQCVNPVPLGWSGPGRETRTAPEQASPKCDSLYPEPQDPWFSGLVAPQPSCQCTCGPAVDAQCEGSARLRFFADDSGCTALSASLTINETTCSSFPNTLAADSHWRVDPVPTFGGSCQPILAAEIEQARYETRISLCRGATAMAADCPDKQRCLPSSEGRLCVWRMGEHDCPGGWPAREVVYRGFEDDRDCGLCTCTDPVGLCDEAEVTLRGPDCGEPVAGTVLANAECVANGPQTVDAATLVTGPPTAFCTATDAEPIGTATPTAPTTMCCDAE